MRSDRRRSLCRLILRFGWCFELALRPQVVLWLLNRRPFRWTITWLLRTLKVSFWVQIVVVFDRSPSFSRSNFGRSRPLEFSFNFQIIFMYNNFSSFGASDKFIPLSIILSFDYITAFTTHHAVIIPRSNIAEIAFDSQIVFVFDNLSLVHHNSFAVIIFSTYIQFTFHFDIVLSLDDFGSINNCVISTSNIPLSFHFEVIFMLDDIGSFSPHYIIIIFSYYMHSSFRFQIIIISAGPTSLISGLSNSPSGLRLSTGTFCVGLSAGLY
nr:unnamed protein product [Callosobruchus analis]